ncbi:hypothetical protein H2200_004113 [Cladophialophora chaetospira]|uniref:Uncharacterized protein n=1 Tax=Cladophialophora chaetospira TaxID=386627 RepID=A0AA39CLP6_9EURO|nr:hypothetical protein H2200_004113 [Cladophialophora chaetospira]
MSEELSKEGSRHLEQDGVAAVEDNNASKRPPFKQRFKRHCARFWWLHFLIFAAIVLVIVLPIVYVAYPHKAQGVINNSQLVATSMAILQPAPNAFNLELSDMFLSNSSLKSHLDPFLGAFSLTESSPPFVKFPVPAIEASNGSQAHIAERVQIANMDEWDKYTKAVLLSEEFDIYLKGKGGLKYGKLPKTTVTYDKQVTVKGLNGLKGFALTDFALITEALKNGTNAHGTVFIPNPTTSTYEMGNLTMNMYVKNTYVGNSTLKDVVIRPGNNTFNMYATTNQTAVVGLLFTTFKCGIFPIDIVASGSTYNGQRLPYYEKALQANNLTVQLNVIKVLEEAGLAQYLGINTTSKENCTGKL